MTFCNNCGYLLPVDFKRTTFCNPCSQINAISYVPKSCDCEFCHNPLNSPVPNSELLLQVDHKQQDSENHDHQYFSSVNGEKSYEHENVEEYYDYNINSSYLCEPPSGGYNDSHGISPADDCESLPDIFSDPMWTTIHDNADSLAEDENWTIVPPRKVHNTRNKFGLQEKKFEGEVRKEDQVSEPLREQWTLEQEELLRKLISVDTCHITRLTSGNRRKSDGSHFYVGGVDISFIKENNIDACACLSVVQMPNLKLVFQRMEMIQLTQPYIPGFLAFREVPPLLKLFEYLKKTAPHYMPDVVMVDGNGILHPRGFGLASHLGVMLDIPTIGVAKTLMTAQGVTDDEEHKKRKQELSEAGHGFDLISQTSGKIIGRCLRVHDEAPNPIYISVGHKISLESACWIALETSQYRIPEPVRRADLDSREYIRQKKTNPQEYMMI